MCWVGSITVYRCVSISVGGEILVLALTGGIINNIRLFTSFFLIFIRIDISLGDVVSKEAKVIIWRILHR